MDVFYIVEDLAPKLFGLFTSEGTGAAKGEVSMSLEALGDPVQHAVIIFYCVCLK